jgi:hypothetical protein
MTSRDWGCNLNTNETIHNIIGKNPELVLGLETTHTSLLQIAG